MGSPTAKESQAVIDGQFASLLPAIQTQQDAFLKANAKGCYFQGLPTHTTPPVDGASTVPDKLATKPSYQDQKWTDLNVLPASLPMSITIDQYVGPNGKGWVITLTATLVGQTWSRSIDSGSEPWRTQAWAILPARS